MFPGVGGAGVGIFFRRRGQILLVIYRVTMGSKSFLAYSGIGTADLSRATELTQLAMRMMAPLSKDNGVWLDGRQRVEVEWRVVSAFHGAKIYFVDGGDRRQGAQDRGGGQRAPEEPRAPQTTSQPQLGGFQGHAGADDDMPPWER
jgi:hypothetical protein